jgi:hypothetical protein
MPFRIRPSTSLTAALAVVLAFALCGAALAKPKKVKLKTPSSEAGIKREIDGAPNIKLDNRARHFGKPSRKRPVNP